jgi:hypothetical protein
MLFMYANQMTTPPESANVPELPIISNSQFIENWILKLKVEHNVSVSVEDFKKMCVKEPIPSCHSTVCTFTYCNLG